MIRNRFIQSTLALTALLSFCAPLAAYADHPIILNTAQAGTEPTVLVRHEKDVLFEVNNPTAHTVRLDVEGTNLRDVAVVPPGCQGTFYLDMSTMLDPQVQYRIVSADNQPLVSGVIMNEFGESPLIAEQIAALQSLQEYEVYIAPQDPEPTYYTTTPAPATQREAVRGYW